MEDISDQPLATPSAVYIDGKRYNTLILEFDDDETRRGAWKALEHIAVANAGNGDFMGEYIPATGSGKDMAIGLKTFLQEKASQNCTL